MGAQASTRAAWSYVQNLGLTLGIEDDCWTPTPQTAESLEMSPKETEEPRMTFSLPAPKQRSWRCRSLRAVEPETGWRTEAVCLIRRRSALEKLVRPTASSVMLPVELKTRIEGRSTAVEGCHLSVESTRTLKDCNIYNL